MASMLTVTPPRQLDVCVGANVLLRSGSKV